MKPCRILSSLLVGSLLAAGPALLRAQHSHINAGAFSPTLGAQLYFVNGDDFATHSGYAVFLTHTNAGPHAGHYQGGITFTALPATIDTGGPAFGHAALGSFLILEVVSLTGPRGGSLGFWEFGDAQPRFSIATGMTTGTNRFDLSEGEGLPGEDPFGHIHGRRFTATHAGLYTLGARIVDTSRNGTGGGPIHTPSELFHLHFQAGFTMAEWARQDGRMEVTFAAMTGHSYTLERADALEPGNAVAWNTVAGPVSGKGHLHTLVDPGATNTHGFYRLRRVTP